MAIEDGLKAALDADTDVNALVAGRIYPEVLPQDVILPAVVYEQQSSPYVQTLSQASNLAPLVYSITSWATTYLGASELADAIRKALDNYAGTWDGETVCVQIVDENDQLNDSPDSELGRRYGVEQEVLVFATVS